MANDSFKVKVRPTFFINKSRHISFCLLFVWFHPCMYAVKVSACYSTFVCILPLIIFTLTPSWGLKICYFIRVHIHGFVACIFTSNLVGFDALVVNVPEKTITHNYFHYNNSKCLKISACMLKKILIGILSNSRTTVTHDPWYLVKPSSKISTDLDNLHTIWKPLTRRFQKCNIKFNFLV